jgi:hypothetical protein
MDDTITDRVKDLWDAGNEIAGHTADHGLPNGTEDLDYNDTIREVRVCTQEASPSKKNPQKDREIYCER